MGDATRARPDGSDTDMTVYRPTPEGGLEAAPGAPGDYREALRSRRWDAAPLANPEVEPTDPRIAVLFIVGLCALTLVLIVVGYASGFWG
ncbi:hypothetical protein BH23CHL8_BH23CHL8_15190 [soil metagenome]